MKKKTNRTFFFIGMTFIGVGVIFAGAVNPALGISFMAMGGMYMILWRKRE
jgi:hypothetical protein